MNELASRPPQAPQNPEAAPSCRGAARLVRVVRSDLFRLFLAAVIAYVLIMVVLSNCYCRYWANDNGGILADIKLGFTVNFMSVLLGKILSLFYLSISPAIPWYPYLLHLFNWISLTLILWAILAQERSRLLAGAMVILICTLFTKFILLMGYNPASFLSGAAALVALACYMHREGNKSWVPVLLLGVCLAFSYMFRINGFKGVVVFSAPMMLLAFSPTIRRHWRLYLVFLAPLIVVVVANKLAIKYGVSEEHREFRRFNSVRSKLHGYPILWRNKGNTEILKANDWSPNDYNMFASFQFCDERKFNIRTLQNIIDHSKPIEDGRYYSWDSMATRARKRMLEPLWAWLVIVTLLTFVPAFTADWRSFVLGCAFVLYAVGGLLALAVFYRLPGTVAFPASMVCIVWLVHILAQRRSLSGWSARARMIVLGIAALTLVGSAALTTSELRKHHKKTRWGRYAMHRSINYLESLGADYFLMQAGVGFNQGNADPMKPPDYSFKKVSSGWSTFSPRFYKLLNEIGMKRGYEAYINVVDNPRAYVVADERWVKQLLKYFEEDHSLQCAAYKLSTDQGRQVPVYRIVKISET